MYTFRPVARQRRSHTAPRADPDDSLPGPRSRTFRGHNATPKRKVVGRFLSPVALVLLLGVGAAAAEWPWARLALAESEAFQYNLPVNGPTQVPADVGALIREFNDQLRVLKTSREVSPQAAATQIDQIIAQFQELAAALNQQRSLLERGLRLGMTKPVRVHPMASGWPP